MSNPWKKSTPILCVGLVTMLSAGCGWSSGGTAQHQANEEMATHSAMEKRQEKKSQGPDQSQATEVRIDNFTFDPPQLTISAGTKVTWINHDDVPHTATSTAKPKVFDSGTLDTDEKFSFVFTTSGTYQYYCAVHPRMTAQIIVK